MASCPVDPCLLHGAVPLSSMVCGGLCLERAGPNRLWSDSNGSCLQQRMCSLCVVVWWVAQRVEWQNVLPSRLGMLDVV